MASALRGGMLRSRHAAHAATATAQQLHTNRRVLAPVQQCAACSRAAETDRRDGLERKAEKEAAVSSIRSAARKGLREEYGAAIGDIEAEGIPVRVRQHVNPLRMQFQRPVPPPEWGDVFHQPDLPLVIDIGVRNCSHTVRRTISLEAPCHQYPL